MGRVTAEYYIKAYMSVLPIPTARQVHVYHCTTGVRYSFFIAFDYWACWL